MRYCGFWPGDVRTVHVRSAVYKGPTHDRRRYRGHQQFEDCSSAQRSRDQPGHR
jgi:hypothetical protein